MKSYNLIGQDCKNAVTIMNIPLAVILVSLCLFLASSCNSDKSSQSRPTIGNVIIGCDIQFKDLMEQEWDAFRQRYKYAQIEFKYHNQSELFKYWKSDSFETIVCGRALTEDEMNYFKQEHQVTPRHFPFAIGAVSLLSNKEAKDSSLSYEQFIELCKGNESGTTGFTSVVIEDQGSGLSRYLLDLTGDENFAGPVYALKEKNSVFDYLRKNSNVIAIMDWSEFSDSDDMEKNRQIKEFKIVKISRPKDSTQMGFLKPAQYHLQDGVYPLTRTWQFITTSGKSDLALGFASFVTGDVGQRILLKAGLLPIYQTERWIQFKEEDFRIVE